MWKINPKKLIQIIRHISQAFFFALFIFLVVGSVCSFSTIIGQEVTYTAPETVTGVEHVKITVYFEGDEKHLPSGASISGLIVGGAGVQELFEVRFRKAVFEEARLENSMIVENLTILTVEVRKVILKNLSILVLGLILVRLY